MVYVCLHVRDQKYPKTFIEDFLINKIYILKLQWQGKIMEWQNNLKSNKAWLHLECVLHRYIKNTTEVYSQFLIYVICVCLGIVVSNIYCVVFLFCFSSFCLPMLPVSLDCPFLIAPSVFYSVYLQYINQIWHKPTYWNRKDDLRNRKKLIVFIFFSFPFLFVYLLFCFVLVFVFLLEICFVFILTIRQSNNRA